VPDTTPVDGSKERPGGSASAHIDGSCGRATAQG
jgi:hypothetical protein